MVCWQPEPPPRTAPHGIPGWARLLLAVASIAGGWWLGGKIIDRLFAPDVPASVAAYADGDGVTTYEHPRYGYSVDLPGPPQVQAMPFRVMNQSFQIDVAFAEVPDLAAGVLVVQLPPGLPAEPDTLLQGGLAGLSGATGATIEDEEPTVHEGRQAVDVTFDVPGGEGKLRFVPIGNVVHVAMVAAPAGVDGAFDHLVESWHLDGTADPV